MRNNPEYIELVNTQKKLRIMEARQMQKRSNLKVVISLIALVKSMLLIMLGAIILGVIITWLLFF